MEYKRITEWDIEGWGEGLASVNGKTSIDKDITLAINRLAELEDKIEQGTLIELPCKVGDTAYHLTSANTLEELGVAEIFDGKVTSISKDKDGLWIYCHYNNGLNFWYSKREIGRKLFFTREEAEKRLKELQDG